jgi:molybdenum cofactor cytidylyltransferase
MNLAQTLDAELPARIAIVGGGGKSTAMFQLTHQIPGLVWATTTTHLGTDQLDYTDQHYIISEPEEIDLPRLKACKSTLITGMFTLDYRLRGPDPEVMEDLLRIANMEGISLVIEADGARSCPLKAPAEHEPVIPGWAKLVIVVVGLSALGKPFNADWIYRPELFANLTGAKLGEPISMQQITKMLVQPEGGLKNIPSSAVKVALFNQADTPELRELAGDAVGELLAGGYDPVVIGALQSAPDELEVFIRIKDQQ